MLNYVRQVIKIRIVFHTLYIWNEDGDPYFFAFLAQLTHYLTPVQIKKKKLSSGKWKIPDGLTEYLHSYNAFDSAHNAIG